MQLAACRCAHWHRGASGGGGSETRALSERRQPAAQSPMRPPSESAGEAGGPQWRLLLILGSVGIAIAYSDRSNISTAIVTMKDEFAWWAPYCLAAA